MIILSQYILICHVFIILGYNFCKYVPDGLLKSYLCMVFCNALLFAMQSCIRHIAVSHLFQGQKESTMVL